MSTSIIRLHVFSGANDSDPPCYLLQIDDFHCLLDCGWDPNFSNEYVNHVAKYCKIIDAVFLSHSDIRNLGALPYLFYKCGLNCPIYATSPVSKLGHLSMYDAVVSKSSNGGFNKFSLDDVDDIFERITTLKYQQTKMLHGKGSGIFVTPYLAGHSLGGAMWKISKDDNDIIYSMDFNHKKELHLNGAAFDTLPRPQLLITSTHDSYIKEKRHMEKAKRYEYLKQTLQSTLRNDGNIMFVSDTAGRSLELIYLLENMWHNQKSGLMAYGLVFLNLFGGNIFEYVQSYIEWMSEKVMQSFEEVRAKPFDFRCTRICHSMDALKQIPDPKVVVVSQSHMEYGYSRELFLEWCDNEKNLIIMTQKSVKYSLGAQLLNRVKEKGKEPFKLIIEELDKVDIMSKMKPDYIFSKNNLLLRNNSANLENELNINEESSDEESESEAMDWEPSNTAVSVKNRNSADKNQVVKHQNSITNSGIDRNDVDNTTNEVVGNHIPGMDVFQPMYQRPTAPGTRVNRATKKMIFPHREYKVTWNEYGEPIDPNDPNYLYTTGSAFAMRAMNQQYMRSDLQTPSTIISNNTKSLLTKQQCLTYVSDYIDALVKTGCAKSSEEMVTKAGVSSREISVNCTIKFEDFEGLSDVSALRQQITRIKPHEVILVSRCDEVIYKPLMQELVGLNSGLLFDKTLHCPANNMIVNCTKESSIVQVRLSDALMSRLKFQRIGKYELAWLDSIVRNQSEAAKALMDTDDIDGAVETDNGSVTTVATGVVDGIVDDNKDSGEDLVDAMSMPILDPPQGIVPPHDTLYINEPKLSDLKTILLKEGFNAEFMGGTLVIDNSVAIKRTEAGKLILEGSLSSTYFNVRRILYSQFAIL